MRSLSCLQESNAQLLLNSLGFLLLVITPIPTVVSSVSPLTQSTRPWLLLYMLCCLPSLPRGSSFPRHFLSLWAYLFLLQVQSGLCGPAQCHKMLQMTLPMAYIGGEKLLETLGDIHTQPLVGRVWKVLEMPREHNSTLWQKA